MNEEKKFNLALSVMLAVIVAVVLIIGYIAIFKHRDCMTRQETRELVDSMMMEVYD